MIKHVFSLFAFLIILIIPAAVFATPALPATYITDANVNLRSEPNTQSDILILVHRDIMVNVTDYRDNDWYSVEYAGNIGYMKAEFLLPQTVVATPEPVAEPEAVVEVIPEPIVEPEPMVEVNPEPVAEPEPMVESIPEAEPIFETEPIPLSVPATLREPFVTTANVNLRKSPSTSAVKLETISRGRTVYVTDFNDYDWYIVEINGRIGYMKAEFLMEESKAPKSEIKYAETSIGNVELINWSEAKSIFKTGVSTQIIDVRTRATFNIRNFSNGNHADVDPITAEDAATLKSLFNNKWSWTTRPILVVVGDRVFAASINGMPHGGSNTPGNGLNGHFCIHFQGSKTHNGSKYHENDHQNSVKEAFNTASTW